MDEDLKRPARLDHPEESVDEIIVEFERQLKLQLCIVQPVSQMMEKIEHLFSRFRLQMDEKLGQNSHRPEKV